MPFLSSGIYKFLKKDTFYKYYFKVDPLVYLVVDTILIEMFLLGGNMFFKNNIVDAIIDKNIFLKSVFTLFCDIFVHQKTLSICTLYTLHYLS